MFSEFWDFMPQILEYGLKMSHKLNNKYKDQDNNDDCGDCGNKMDEELPQTLSCNKKFQETLLYKNGWLFEKDIESEVLLFRRLANNYSKMFTKLFDIQRTNLHDGFTKHNLIEKYMHTISDQPFIFIAVSVHK